MRIASLLGCALLACGALLTASCSAHNNAGSAAVSATATAGASAAPDHAAPSDPFATGADPAPAVTATFTEGKQYVKLPLPAGQTAPTGPIVVTEVFSYGCPHCAEFAPYMDKLRAELPKGVQVNYMPAVFSAAWMPFAQAFYAARQLGILDQTHDALFQAMLEHYPLNSLQDLAAWYGRHGTTPQKFTAAATSAQATQQMAADQRTEIGWGIDETPTLVVGRRTGTAANAPFVGLLRSADIDSYAQLQQLGLWMAQRLDKH